MQIKTGIDIVRVRRIEALLKDPSASSRIFASSELTNQKTEHLAGIFALKEAFFKATQIKVKRWNEIEISYINGKPEVIFDHSLISFKVVSIDSSISHDGEYAVAIVTIIAELGEN